MDKNKIHAVESRAVAICEEFCRYVAVDTTSYSLLTNTKHSFYDELSQRLEKIGYKEVFRACVHPRNTITSTFIFNFDLFRD